MSSLFSDPEPEEMNAIREQAARWVVRRDRRLSAEEATEFEAWLAADVRHAAAFERSAATWKRQREIGAGVRRMPATEPATRTRRNWAALGGVAAAVAVGLVVFFERHETNEPTEAPSAVVAHAVASVTTRTLADGSVARLKDEAEIAEVFTVTERRVKLLRGVAYFTVTKDAARPFYVEAGKVTVRAVGTAFSVNFEPGAVDVWVTEGTVQVAPPVAETPSAAAMVQAGHRALVARAREKQTPAVIVTAVTPAEIAQTLAWNEPMLDLGGSTLGELVATFAARSGRRFEIADPALAAVRIGGRFPTDDVDGFVRALEEIYGVKAERRADGVIALTKPKAP